MAKGLKPSAELKRSRRQSRHDLSSGIASEAAGLGFTLGGLIFGRWRKA